MIEEQRLIEIRVDDLLSQAADFYKAGYRLAQIGCAKMLECLEINYSFDKEYHFTSLKIKLADLNTEVPSISNIYWCAFLYENEAHDLFGVKFKGIVLDYQGNFYRTCVKQGFNPKNEQP